LFTETTSNPCLDLCDLNFLGKLAKKNNLLYIVDNSFATPYLQNPVKFGANIITHSATKFIDGQGRTMGGAVLGPKNIIKDIQSMARQIGTTLAPFNAWILSKSLETLSLRMDRHCENALKLARFLETQNEIKIVNYPFLESSTQYKLAKKQMKSGGGLVTFEMKNGKKTCFKFIDQLKMISITSNLGDSRTSITHPATTTHSKLTPEERKDINISDSMVRVSVGLENIEDIIADIQQALEKCVKK
jgi:O-succinylhomoserine sulfhydrylase